MALKDTISFNVPKMISAKTRTEFWYGKLLEKSLLPYR